MARLRRLTPAGRRLLMAALAFALFARALVPAGWMPAEGGGLMLCDGMAPAAVQPAHHAHGKHAPGPHTPTTADHPCAFAGPVAAVEAPVFALPLPLARPEPVPYRRHALARIGQGLAAPPPPSTGPPAFA